MNSPIEGLLSRYTFTTIDDTWQALREIVQEIILLGLWRGKFFEHAAFYGGTALRIIHRLPRYSEDMDFSLLRPDPEFELSRYFSYVEAELRAYGFDVAIVNEKRNVATAIESAFVKMNTRVGFLNLGVSRIMVEQLSREQVLKVKFEIDIDPPDCFQTEIRYRYLPQAFSVRLYDLSSMFAGKLHAAIARAWKTRVKGRDWFDLVWFAGKNVPVLLHHLKARLVQTGHIESDAVFTEQEARVLLCNRIKALEIGAAKNDVLPFLLQKDADQLDIWSREFFLDLAERITFA